MSEFMNEMRSYVTDDFGPHGWTVVKGVCWLVLAAFVLALLMMARQEATRRECLALGYIQSAVDITFQGYCGARINQTDVVVTLDEARRNPRR